MKTNARVGEMHSYKNTFEAASEKVTENIGSQCTSINNQQPNRNGMDENRYKNTQNQKKNKKNTGLGKIASKNHKESGEEFRFL